MKSTRLCAAMLLAALGGLPLQAQDDLGRVPLEHDDYDAWSSVRSPALSEDGRWAVYTVQPAEGAGTLTIREVATRKQYTIRNGSRARFSHDSRHVAYLVQPDPELLEKLEEEDRRDEAPEPKLELLDLETDRTVTLPDVRSFGFPERGSGWLAYTPSKIEGGGAARAGTSELTETYAIDPAGLVKVEPQEPEAKDRDAKDDAGDKKVGEVLVLRDLATGIERRFPHVSSHRFSRYGARLAFAASAPDGEDDGVFVLDLETAALTQVIAGRGHYRSLAWSEDEAQLAFLSDRDDFGPVVASQTLYLWSVGDDEAAPLVAEGHAALPDGWWLASSGPVFTEDGRRLLFETRPKPEDAGKTKKQLEKEKKARQAEPVAVLDVWHWQDPSLQPQQLLRAERERNRSYRALVELATGAVVQVATEEVPDVSIDRRSSADVAVGTSSLPYATSRSWESPGFSDSYLIDLTTGEASLILERCRGTAQLSPNGAHVTWWDPDQERQFAQATAGGEVVDLSAGIPTSLANELHDTPAPPRSYRSAGWLDDDAALLLYDRFDVWQVDPTGAAPTVCLTGEQGRAERVRYRYLRLDPDERTIDPTAPLWLSLFDEGTKASGYATLDPTTGELTTKIRLDERVGGLRKARRGDTVLLTRQTFRRYPDLWATTTAFEELKRLSQANPQQRDYLWGSAELVHFEAADGTPLDGILIKPDNFDPTAKYPMIVYFYERSSDRLHSYQTPSAGGSSINYSFYASRGYLVFVPDIPYTTGQPGPSAANAILPGIQSIVDRGFVDEAAIGVQGHSWGGYQIAYLVTMTDVFACAEAGAPVSNMTSAYGGIRWSSGMSRMFQYEKTQSRIGDTLWNARDLYLDNSPIFHADKIETPLLILHNDEDGAVPWYQGIELFVALRRLGKPAWMLNYNGEGHGLRKEENRLDFAERMQQFFDHHLKGAPATEWITDGVPATEKGRNLGLEVPGEEEPEPEPAEEPAEPTAEPVEVVEALPAG